MTSRLALKRIAAFMVDWCVLALFIGLLFLFVSPFVAPLFMQSPFMAEAAGFCLLTLPLFLYFSLTEALIGGSLGKKFLRLRVSTVKAQQMRYRTSALRTGIKLVPWELAHFAIWNVFIFSASPAYGLGVGALGLSYGLIIIYATSLFLKRGRTPYDLIAQTIVSEDKNKYI